MGQKGDVNYGKLIFTQLERINILGSKNIITDKYLRQEWKQAILQLESFLDPELKKEYWEQRENIKERNTVQGFRTLYTNLMWAIKKADLLPAEKTYMHDESIELMD